MTADKLAGDLLGYLGDRELELGIARMTPAQMMFAGLLRTAIVVELVNGTRLRIMVETLERVAVTP